MSAKQKKVFSDKSTAYTIEVEFIIFILRASSLFLLLSCKLSSKVRMSSTLGYIEVNFIISCNYPSLSATDNFSLFIVINTFCKSSSYLTFFSLASIIYLSLAGSTL